MSDIIIGSSRVIVRLDHLENNFNQVRKLTPKHVKIAAVVKANGYGHGAVMSAQQFVKCGADMLACANVSEAMQLRKLIKEHPILVMGYTPGHQLPLVAEYDLIQTVFSLDQAEILSRVSVKSGKKAVVHIKVDTGFNRLGLQSYNPDTVLIIEKICSLPGIKAQGFFSHLALGCEQEDQIQFEKFQDLLSKLEARGISFELRHICDSISGAVYPDYHMDMIRVGASLYGYISRETPMNLIPALTVVSKLSQVKEIQAGEGVSYDYTFKAEKPTMIGTVPIGYADGVPRSLSNTGEVCIRGKRAKIAGLMCMDQCMVDLSNIPGAAVGDDVVFFGEYGQNKVHLNELIGICKTNRNEMLARLMHRLPRVYVDKNVIVKADNPLMA